MTKKQLLKTDIKRAKGKLYFCGTSEDGFITLMSTDMSHGGRPKKEKKEKK